MYEVARADAPDFSLGCIAETTTAAYRFDAELPAPGAGFYYLSRALAPLPGSWGADSTGVERAIDCP